MVLVDSYQELIKKFAKYPPEKALEYLTLGLSSEAGEVAGKVKKVLRDKDGQFTQGDIVAISAELGDVAWYLCMLATVMDIPMSEVLQNNYDKLEGRYQRGVIGGSGDNR